MNSRVAEAGSPRPSVQFSLMFLLDTNTFIYFFKGQGRVPERMLATPPGEVAISAVSLYEIEVGIAKSAQPAKRRRQFDTFLAVVSLLPFDRPAARAAATVRAELERRGRPIGPLDNLIAGTALPTGLPWSRATRGNSPGYLILPS